MDDAFGHWLAGFADGEGCFYIGQNNHGARYCGFRIALHHEDEPILREIAERTGLGRVGVQNSPSQKAPRAIWDVGRKADCLALVVLFDRFPLRAKKRRDFEIWSAAVQEWNRLKWRGNQYNNPGPLDYSEIDRLRHKLWAGRPSRGPEPVVGVV